jgi:hypothetical protein
MDQSDVWRCLDADTGEQVWQLTYSTCEEPA